MYLNASKYLDVMVGIESYLRSVWGSTLASDTTKLINSTHIAVSMDLRTINIPIFS